LAETPGRPIEKVSKGIIEPAATTEAVFMNVLLSDFMANYFSKGKGQI
jgi:hypothetical protein